MKIAYSAIGLVSFILLVYATLGAFQIFPGFVLLIFSLSPLFVIWMVWVVLKYGTYDGRELKEGEEYGYGDRPASPK